MDYFKNKAFDVEHALVMYANSFVTFPAFAIYEDASIKKFSEVSKRCHVYLVGHTPRISYRDFRQEGRTANLIFEINSELVEIETQLPENARIFNEGEYFRVINEDGRDYHLDRNLIAQSINRKTKSTFQVLYIGQAYGKNGKRAALDRLIKHETLQKISLQDGAPRDRILTLLLLEVIPSTTMMTYINPFAKDRTKGQERISSGIDKLYRTTPKERICLYEAALIRYFQPRYNKEFKDSFPSTNIKILNDCYEKDFSAVVAEINFDNLPWALASDTVSSAHSHIAKFNLHNDEARSMFFSNKK